MTRIENGIFFYMELHISKIRGIKIWWDLPLDLHNPCMWGRANDLMG